MLLKNFIFWKGFLSHRYGTRSLPTRIIRREYEIFKSEIEANSELKLLDFSFSYDNKEEISLNISNLFEFCYQLDENEIPARYRLKHMDKIIPSFNDKVIKL